VGVSGQRHAPGRFTKRMTLYSLYRRLNGTQGPSGQVRKISPPPGFDPRTVQPVPSHYAAWAIRAQNFFQCQQEYIVNSSEHFQHWLVAVRLSKGYYLSGSFFLASFTDHLTSRDSVYDVTLAERREGACRSSRGKKRKKKLRRSRSLQVSVILART
jgi:hypothetical protein